MAKEIEGLENNVKALTKETLRLQQQEKTLQEEKREITDNASLEG